MGAPLLMQKLLIKEMALADTKFNSLIVLGPAPVIPDEGINDPAQSGKARVNLNLEYTAG